jgi:hypothetical protein
MSTAPALAGIAPTLFRLVVSEATPERGADPVKLALSVGWDAGWSAGWGAA